MARCKECLHYEVCAKEGRLVQVDEHTWDEYNKLDDVEQFCTNYFAADVVPKSEVDMSQHLLKDAWKRIEELDELCGELQKSKTEVAREIFEEMEKWLGNYNGCRVITYEKFVELKKKYMEDEK